MAAAGVEETLEALTELEALEALDEDELDAALVEELAAGVVLVRAAGVVLLDHAPQPEDEAEELALEVVLALDEVHAPQVPDVLDDTLEVVVDLAGVVVVDAEEAHYLFVRLKRSSSWLSSTYCAPGSGA